MTEQRKYILLQVPERYLVILERETNASKDPGISLFCLNYYKIKGKIIRFMLGLPIYHSSDIAVLLIFMLKPLINNRYVVL